MNGFAFRMPNEIATMDFNDTFLNMDHLRASFPEHEIRVQTDDPVKLVPPFRLVEIVFPS
jgi:intron-binding protein aquarius